MFRKSAVAAAVLCASVSPQVFSLGLGEIDMRSALNQPMDAVIELTSASAAELQELRVSLASLQAHERAGMSKAAILADFRFQVEKDASGKPVIRISSDELVQEPFLEFLLEMDWSRGRMLRRYTVLVDPPVMMPATPPVPAAAHSEPARPAPATTLADSQPSRRPLAAPATVTVAPPPAANDYGPIRRSETLWSIAERVRPGSDISVEQMMLALLRSNPQAFEGNNINRLRAGVTLTVPERNEILSITARDARAESRRQYAEWKKTQEQPDDAATNTPAAVQDSEAVTAAPATPAESVSEARLQLTAPETEAVTGAAAPGDPLAGETTASGQELQQQLALAVEEAAAGRAQTVELQSRVDELEEQITTMQRLLELKDDELARLQQSVIDSEEQLLADETAPAADMEAAVAEEEAPREIPAEASDVALLDEQQPEEATTSLAEMTAGLASRLMANPLLAGLGVLVIMLLGGILWFTSRSRQDQEELDDVMTMRREPAEEEGRGQPVFTGEVPVREVPVQSDDSSPALDDDAEGDPVTEADVYLAYGRIQQAEDVLLAALESSPENADARLKLLEVYHSGGNAGAFDQAAAIFHEMFGEEDQRWQQITAMGLSLSPHNVLYGGGEQAPESESEFDMDLSGLEDDSTPASNGGADRDDSNMVEFTLDPVEDDDAGEGLLDSEDEVTTKLDLARAYIDMDDRDSARSILGEVMEEGNAEQVEEAEEIISKLA